MTLEQSDHISETGNLFAYLATDSDRQSRLSTTDQAVAYDAQSASDRFESDR